LSGITQGAMELPKATLIFSAARAEPEANTRKQS